MIIIFLLTKSYQCLCIVDKVLTQLQFLQDNLEKKISKKTENILSKNIGLKILKQISSILSGYISTINGLPEEKRVRKGGVLEVLTPSLSRILLHTFSPRIYLFLIL